MKAQGSTTLPPAPNRRTYAILAVAAALFIAYGSFVPLDFRFRPFGEVVEAFRWSMTHRIVPQSRSDALTNFLVGIPLGFALLAMSRVDRDSDRRRDVAVGVAWLPACLALSAAVEFIQLYLPTRTSAASDVLLQAVGAAAGMGVWILFGRELNATVRALWSRTRDGGTIGRLLLAYLLLIAFMQSLPLDLEPGPKELYRKIRDQAHLVPFVEFHGVPDAKWDAASKFVKFFGVFLPAGLLASRHRRIGPSAVRMLGFAIVVAVAAEAIQIAVRTRIPSSTDVVAGFAGVVIGWLLGRCFAAGISFEAALLLGQAWAAALLVAYWHPFSEHWPRASFDWYPGMPMENPNPLLTLVELLEKPVIFCPFGILTYAVASRLPPGRMLLMAAGVGVAIASAIEIGQLYLGSHYPGTTDIILAGVGAFAGAWIASRID